MLEKKEGISTGIRILDKVNRVVSVELSDILKEIKDGQNYYWSILFFDIEGCFDKDIQLPEYTDKINKSENGLFLNWNELVDLSKRKINQIIDLVLIGSKDINILHRYEDEVEMYSICDMVIVMFDTSYWEVFSKDHSFINRLAKKFKDVKFLEPDFER